MIFTYSTSEDAADELAARTGAEAYSFSMRANPFDDLIIAARSLGRLDLLVNNASQYEPDEETFDEHLFTEVFETNVHVPMRLCEALAPVLKQSRGHVVNMLDLMAERPMPSYSIYCASKAALLNATLSLARKLAPEVTVNGISPGVVAWPDDMHQADRDAYLKRVPLARAGTPQDVAELVHFLATGGSYITGQIIRLDGGRSIVP